MGQLIEQLKFYLREVWRFRWIAVIAMWVICVSGWFVLSKIPNTYESKAVVYVDTASLLRPLLRGMTVEVNVAEKLGLMTQQLLSRKNFEAVMRETDLDLDVTTQREFENALAALEKNVTLKQSHAARSSRSRNPDLYTISARHKDAETAQRIVQALLNTFVKNTAADQKSRTETAQQFLEQQIGEYESRLTEAENRLQQFKRHNIDFLPDQEASFYQRLQAARSNLEEVELALREARFRQEAIRDQLDSTPSGQRAVSADGTVVQTPTEERILALQRRVDELLLRFTPRHPDVIEAQRSIEQLEAQREQESQDIESGGAGSRSVPNPAHQQLQLSLGEVEAEIAGLQVRRQEFRSRVENLQHQIEKLTKVEAELQTLNRNYEIYREQYNDLVARRESARISEDVEQSGEDVKFEIINQPRVPISPVSPPRLQLSFAVLFAGLAGGIGVALLLSQFRPVVYGRHMLAEVTGRPVFGGVSQYLSKGARFRRGLAVSILVLCGLLIIPTYGVVAYVQVSGKDLTALINRLETLDYTTLIQQIGEQR